LQSTFAACFHTCTDTFIKCYSYSLSNTCWLDAMFSLLALVLLGVLPLPLAGITLLGSCSSSSTASPSYSNNVTWLWHVEHRNTTTGMAAWQARTAIHVTIFFFLGYKGFFIFCFFGRERYSLHEATITTSKKRDVHCIP